MRRTRPMKATHETLHSLADAYRPADNAVRDAVVSRELAENKLMPRGSRKRLKAHLGQWVKKFGG